ncbi:MAG TPA: hypothetical protein VFE84_09305 [Patescibacteria group bacterium]|nr:hypothetical protein [Patescibacteria group bacterium]
MNDTEYSASEASRGDAPRGDAPRGEAPRGDVPRQERLRPSQYGYDPRTKSPTLAGFLSLMPGLGQVYVGYYQRGFVHIMVVASVIALLANDALPALIPLLGLFLAFFWLYNVIDAARRASLYNMALRGADPMAMPEDFELPGTRGSVAGGVTLMLVGFLLLLHTRFDVSLDWLRDWWPVAPLMFGAWLVYKGMTTGGMTNGRKKA